MKKLMILGALIGFSSALFFGLLQRAPWPELIWRSAIMCFVSSVLFRWWGRVWLRSLHEARLNRLRASELQEAPPANV
jgi:hypothetical protein